MHSIRSKITLLIALSMLIATISITVIACLNIRSHTYAEAEREIDSVAAGQTAFISGWLESHKRIITATLRHSGEENISYYLQQLAEAGGFNVIYEGNGSSKDMLYSVPGRSKPSAEYNPAARPWFIEANAANGVIISGPYPDSEPATKGQLVITFAQKAKDPNIVIGGDILITDLVKSTLATKLAGKGHVFLTTKDGKIIAYPKTGFDLKPISDLIPGLTDSEFSARLSGGKHASVFAIDGEDYLIELSPVAGSDWVLGVALDKAEIDAPLHRLVWIIISALCVVLLVVILFCTAYLRRLLAGLLQIRDAMLDISQGEADLTRRIPSQGHDEVAETAQAFNHFIERLNTMFIALRHEAIELTGGVSEVSNSVLRLASDSHHLADISSANAAAIEEVSVSISHIADAARETDDLVKAAALASQHGSENVLKISREMANTRQSVGDLSSLLASLEHRSQDISKITNVIRDIADQTNLLALNAAIEAARAGEEGRGFAVVADEVRKLAERTGKATMEISQMISDILGETGRAVGNMQTTVKAVDTSSALTQTASGQMQQIGDSMQQVMERISEIALSTGEQHNATTAMAQSTESINGQILDSDAALQSSMHTLKTLDELAKEMQSTFNRFKL
ncbi:methyl-accepting chemotaxis protein [Iodobacter sp. LRB]|uniref:methyl-accepting chemotaxis protein n=1 Tax=unclassified Iodobacter TaxID=235634 RepID=UPI000C106919|nr:methyl-accepting chemotaxis protein [Iodobacter sp. BJB302]PHV02433.1 chemotaxis protein [Iodobacter sp. BJB302]